MEAAGIEPASKNSPLKSFYMLSRQFNLARYAPAGQITPSQPGVSYLLCPESAQKASLSKITFPFHRQTIRKENVPLFLIKRQARKRFRRSNWQLCFFHRINEEDGPRHATLCFFIPVEASSPPYIKLCYFPSFTIIPGRPPILQAALLRLMAIFLYGLEWFIFRRYIPDRG